ncbi:zinc knuckle [Ostertagia ostertagi]
MGSSVSKFSQGSRLERPMCFECGAFGHLRAQCQAKQGRTMLRAYQYADFVDSEISKLVHSKAIQEVEDHGNLRINPISVAVDLKRKWKTIVTQVARVQTEQCALSFRWKLSREERSELSDWLDFESSFKGVR